MEATYRALNPWWEGKDFFSGIPRRDYLARLPVLLDRPQIEILIGSRRAGKTTLLKQLVKEILGRGTSAQDLLFLALDHPRLSGVNLADHLKAFRKIHRHGRDRKTYLFLDEVQESPGWEAELKALYDLEQVKLFCTGSTASLLALQGGKLTGRQIVQTVHPLGFHEFVRFRGGEPSLAEDHLYERLVDEYLLYGGYPEQALRPSEDYLRNLVEDILARDLIRLTPVKKPFLLKELLRLVAVGIGSRTSFNRLGKVLGLSVDTVREYLHHLESAFLVGTLEKWTSSYSEKVYAQKKIYLEDTGVKTLFTGAGDEGNKAENAVHSSLKRIGEEPGYFAESEREVDFVIGPPDDPLPFEVKYVDRFDWDDRRFSGLKLFLRRFPATRRAIVVSRCVDTQVVTGRTTVRVIPLWRFLLAPASVLKA